MTARKTFLQRHAVVLTLLAVLIAAITVWKIGSPKWHAKYDYSRVSPDQRYRVETWTAYYFTSNDYGFARLYDNRTGQLMCESGVEWLTGNGQIIWPDSAYQEVSVGMNIYLALSADGATCESREHPTPQKK